ncbi:MAG: 3-deoxy-D-manno-octulosonic acid transferase [Desulfatitalea sp.]|nr:3-deoxy-D-manno-octulosonic acid transferase [Desulfatitalea sp.]NNK00895.1 3-deoxy-D-manno-octulosonic acid transferase [Desulfatitalea sp.]
MILIYNLLLFFGILLALPLLPAIFSGPKRRRIWRHRLGMHDNAHGFIADKNKHVRPVWIHALSVGEVLSAEPLITRLVRQHPHRPIVVSASTRSGMQIAKRRFVHHTSRIIYFPYDLPCSIRRVVQHVNPALVVIVETDIWPNFLWYLQKQGIPVMLVNARLSDRSLRACQLLGNFVQRVFNTFVCIAAQSPTDAARYRQLGVLPSKVAVTGNVKFDLPDPDRPLSGDDLRRHLGIQVQRKVLVLGSVHQGEERIASVLWQRLGRYRPLLIVVPRDPTRAGKVYRKLCDQGMTVRILSDWKYNPTYRDSDALVVDTIGMLRTLYSLADVVFVGGTFVAEGGHNPLEPAAAGKAILFGPDMRDFRDSAEQLIEKGGAIRVSSVETLCVHAEYLLTAFNERQAMGGHAQLVINENKGAADRVVAIMTAVLQAQGKAP